MLLPVRRLALGLLLGCLPATVLRGGEVDPRIPPLLFSISQDRLKQILERLGSFGTRHLLSSADSPTRGIGSARQWILEEMKRSSSRLEVNFDAYRVAKQGVRITRDVELRNVVAILPGRSPRRVYITAHYDSVARRTDRPPAPATAGDTALEGASGFDWTMTDNTAPGINDDGSGTALTMELARVFAESGLAFDATLVFVAFAGEEERLVGASLHARKAAEEKTPIEAVLNNDIVGNPRGGNGISDDGSVRVFSEGPEDSPSRSLARFVSRQAARYVPSHRVRLMAMHDRFGRGGDHTAFNHHGFAAVRFTESRENYARQHSVLDTLEGVSIPYLLRNAWVNAAAAATLALAPPAPNTNDSRGRPRLARQPSGYDASLKWEAAPGATGYRVFWRESWTLDWQHELSVGNVTEVLLKDVSIDDYVFGVASLGPDGDESLVSVYTNRPRPFEEVKTQ